MKTYTSMFKIHAPQLRFLCAFGGGNILLMYNRFAKRVALRDTKRGLAKHAKNIIFEFLSLSLSLLPKMHFLKQMSFRF